MGWQQMNGRWQWVEEESSDLERLLQTGPSGTPTGKGGGLFPQEYAQRKAALEGVQRKEAQYLESLDPGSRRLMERGGDIGYDPTLERMRVEKVTAALGPEDAEGYFRQRQAEKNTRKAAELELRFKEAQAREMEAETQQMLTGRDRELEGLLEIGRAYGEEWDFNSSEAARAYYEGPFMEERKREREEAERHHKRQALVGGLTRQGMDPADAETHADIAEAYPGLYNIVFPRPKTDDPIRQRVEEVEDQLFDQIPDYFEMRDEDRMSLISQADSYNRRGIAWQVVYETDEAGRRYPVVVRVGAVKEPERDEVEGELVEEPTPYETPPEARPGEYILDALGRMLSGSEGSGEGAYGLYELPPPSPKRKRPVRKGPHVRSIKKVK